MHTLAKASTLGILLVLFGAAISLHDANDITSLLLAAVLQILASPPASNMLSRATYLAEDIPSRVDVIDEGADRRAGSVIAAQLVCTPSPMAGYRAECRSGALPWWRADGDAWQRRVDRPKRSRVDGPVGVGGDDLVAGAGDEVPPHEHGFVERDAADEERAGRHVHE